MAKIQIEHWGEIPYREAWERQKERPEQSLRGEANDTLIICSHPPVVTLGKKAVPEDLRGWKGAVYRVERGGRATYHGPGQVVAYPIINLRRRGYNLSGLLEALEDAVIESLLHYGLKACAQRPTGVWVGEQKVASIGLAVKRWVSYHGLALNLYRDPLAFQGISPCGQGPSCMVSVEELLNRKIPRREFEERLAFHLVCGIEAL